MQEYLLDRFHFWGARPKAQPEDTVRDAASDQHGRFACATLPGAAPAGFVWGYNGRRLIPLTFKLPARPAPVGLEA